MAAHTAEPRNVCEGTPRGYAAHPVVAADATLPPNGLCWVLGWLLVLLLPAFPYAIVSIPLPFWHLILGSLRCFVLIFR